jgi:hypothetical protein
MSPQADDDFKLIRGIGPTFARRLHDAGIHTYTRLASLSPAKVAAAVAGPSTEQIAKQDWIGQARQLASQQRRAKHRTKKAVPRGDLPLHSENFSVELVLYKDNRVHHTNVKHIQKGSEDQWNGWQVERLADFLVQNAGLWLPPTEPAPPTTMETGLVGILRLRDLEIVPSDVGGPCNALRYGQPFYVHLILDLTDVIAPSELPLAYTAAIYAKKMGGPRQIVGEAHGSITPVERVTISVKGAALPRGIYLLKAVVTLNRPSAVPSPRAGLMALLEGGVLQVY